MIIGIDPGLGGAIALFEPRDHSLIVEDIPVAPNAAGKNEVLHPVLYQLIAEAKANADSGTVEAWVERVNAMPSAGGRKMGTSSAFRFGQVFGAVQMAIAAARIPIRLVTPGRWKPHFKLYGADKDASRQKACERFPDASDLFRRKKDADRAEAALIALYGHENPNG